MFRCLTSRSALLVVLALSPALGSCAGFWAPLEELVEHRNPVVAIPSRCGSAIGFVVGIPVGLVALPVTASLAVSKRGPLIPLAPAFFTSQVGAIVVGGPLWLLFGWWGAESPERADDDAPRDDPGSGSAPPGLLGRD